MLLSQHKVTLRFKRSSRNDSCVYHEEVAGGIWAVAREQGQITKLNTVYRKLRVHGSDGSSGRQHGTRDRLSRYRKHSYVCLGPHGRDIEIRQAIRPHAWLQLSIFPHLASPHPHPVSSCPIMSTTKASNEKAPSPPDRPLSGLELKPSERLDSASASLEKSPTPDLRITAPVEDDPKPVSFFTLFRSVLVSSTYSFVILTLSSDSPLAQSSFLTVFLFSRQ